MSGQIRTDQDLAQTVECNNLTVSYIPELDSICIQHFSEDDELLSEAIMEIEEAMSYAKSINNVIDKALGIF